MSLDIREEPLTSAALSEHAAIPIAFVVDRILEVRLLDGGRGGISLTETAVTDPYVKDYDALEDAGPQRWPGRFSAPARHSAALAALAWGAGRNVSPGRGSRGLRAEVIRSPPAL